MAASNTLKILQTKPNFSKTKNIRRKLIPVLKSHDQDLSSKQHLFWGWSVPLSVTFFLLCSKYRYSKFKYIEKVKFNILVQKRNSMDFHLSSPFLQVEKIMSQCLFLTSIWKKSAIKIWNVMKCIYYHNYFLGDYLQGVLPAQAQKSKFFEKNCCITRTDR